MNITNQTWVYIMIYAVPGYIPLKEPRVWHIFIWIICGNSHTYQRSIEEYWFFLENSDLVNSTKIDCWIIYDELNICLLYKWIVKQVYIIYT